MAGPDSGMYPPGVKAAYPNNGSARAMDSGARTVFLFFLFYHTIFFALR